MVVVLLFYPKKWIDHKIEDKKKIRVERRFGKGARHDESVPIIESVNSSMIF